MYGKVKRARDASLWLPLSCQLDLYRRGLRHNMDPQPDPGTAEPSVCMNSTDEFLANFLFTVYSNFRQNF